MAKKGVSLSVGRGEKLPVSKGVTDEALIWWLVALNAIVLSAIV